MNISEIKIEAPKPTPVVNSSFKANKISEKKLKLKIIKETIDEFSEGRTSPLANNNEPVLQSSPNKNDDGPNRLEGRSTLFSSIQSP